MEFRKCSRCGSFYVTDGYVCPKCSAKDNLEFSTFQNYIKENGIQDNLDIISGETGISVKNINRFLGYDSITKIVNNSSENNNISINGNIKNGINLGYCYFNIY